MNINDQVWVRLTKYGKATFSEYAASQYTRPDHLGYIHLELWFLMHVFGGDKMNMVARPPFEMNQIFWESPASKHCEDAFVPNGEPDLVEGCE